MVRRREVRRLATAKIDTRSRCVAVDDAQAIGAQDRLVKAEDTPRETSAILETRGQRYSHETRVYPGIDQQEVNQRKWLCSRAY